MNTILNLKQSDYQVFKWTGSKWLIAKDIISYLPKEGSTYYEPFLGGGAMLVYAIPLFNKTIGGDIYDPLIKLWKLIQNDPLKVEKKYFELWNKLKIEVETIDPIKDKGKNLPKTFYKCREDFNKNKDPKLLLFLTKTCLNGVIRFSNKGDFNNSFHHGRLGQNPKSFSLALQNLSNHIKSTKFYAKDAFKLIKDIEKDDFIFFDPPYFGSKNRYIENFEIKKLEELLSYANSKRAKWICTYDYRNNVKINKKLYKNKIESRNYQSRIKRLSGQENLNTQELIYLNF